MVGWNARRVRLVVARRQRSRVRCARAPAARAQTTPFAIRGRHASTRARASEREALVSEVNTTPTTTTNAYACARMSSLSPPARVSEFDLAHDDAGLLALVEREYHEVPFTAVSAVLVDMMPRVTAAGKAAFIAALVADRAARINLVGDGAWFACHWPWAQLLERIDSDAVYRDACERAARTAPRISDALLVHLLDRRFVSTSSDSLFPLARQGRLDALVEYARYNDRSVSTPVVITAYHIAARVATDTERAYLVARCAPSARSMLRRLAEARGDTALASALVDDESESETESASSSPSRVLAIKPARPPSPEPVRRSKRARKSVERLTH